MGESGGLRKLKNLDISYPDTFAVKYSQGRWEAFNFLRYISREVADAIYDGNGRIIVEAPPRHGKSWLISYWLCVWFLNMYPEKRIILSTYSDTFADSWGQKVRDEILTNEMLSVKIRSDASAQSDFQTTMGGGMITMGVGGGITGRGGDLIVVDDPIKNLEEAYSEVYREKTWNWFQATLSTRTEPGGTIIILMTRWHEDDLVGRLLTRNPGEWREIKLPAVAEGPLDVLGRKAGEALCPERYDIESLNKKKVSLPSGFWNALYQQRPSALEGNLFKRDNWRHWDRRILPPKFDQELISMDTNVEEGADNDYTTIGHWARKGPNFYLMQQIRGIWSMSQQLSNFRLFCQQRPHVITKLIEKKANGPAIQNLLKKSIPGIVLVEPMGSKYERAQAVEPYQVAGNIFLPEDDAEFKWVEDFKDECANFPKAKNDDQVDEMTQAINYMNGNAGDFLEKITKE